jgi:hypothetical protein
MLLGAQTAMSWSINPAKWTLYHVDDYEIEPYEWPIEITNDGDSPITVKLSVKEPEKTYAGFEPMPDLDWVDINKTTLEVPANSKMRTEVYLDIENASENYGQSWEFWIFADQTAGAGNIQTDYNCRWMVKTPKEYVPIWERPGYIHWPTVIGIMVAGLGGVAAVIVWAKNGKKKKKKTPSGAQHTRSSTSSNADNKSESTKKKSTTIKFQKS